MTLMLVEENGVKAVEGAPGEPWLTRAEDASRIVEACLSHATRSALLYAENLSPRFRIFENRQAARDWIRAARLAAEPSTSSSA